MPSNTRKAVQTIRYSTLSHVGPRLFNSLPKSIRDASGCSVDEFKGMLDRLLALVPDQPLIPGLTDLKRIDTNSISDWIDSPYLSVQDWQCAPTGPSAAQAVTP